MIGVGSLGGLRIDFGCSGILSLIAYSAYAFIALFRSAGDLMLLKGNSIYSRVDAGSGFYGAIVCGCSFVSSSSDS